MLELLTSRIESKAGPISKSCGTGLIAYEEEVGRAAVPNPKLILIPEVLSVHILNNRFLPRVTTPLSPPGPTRDEPTLMEGSGIQTEEKVAILWSYDCLEAGRH